MNNLPTPFGCESTFATKDVIHAGQFVTAIVQVDCTPIKRPHDFINDGDWVCVTCGYNVYDEMHHVDISNLKLL